MSKFDILDDCNFGAPYLLPPSLFLTKFVDLDSNSNLVLVAKISAQSKML